MEESRPLRFRCQMGHACTADALASATEEVDEAIRVAMRVMEERVTLVERMARARDSGALRKPCALSSTARRRRAIRSAVSVLTWAVRAWVVGRSGPN